jgi:putative two-component system response regulator
MPASSITHARILIASNCREVSGKLTALLQRAGYPYTRAATDPHGIRTLYGQFRPDLVLADLHSVSRSVAADRVPWRILFRPGGGPSVLALVARGDRHVLRHALLKGARDYLTRPFDAEEVLLRVRNLLELRALRHELRRERGLLEEKVEERTAQLEEAQIETLERLALAAEYRDDHTGRHTRRVGQISALVAQALGLPGGEVALVRRAAPLHDVGKIGIPDRILLKPGKLSAAEYEQMQAHTSIGARILSGSSFPLLQRAAEIAASHHERWDGSGYPNGLQGEAIPLEGRIVAVVDVWDALTHQRPYKPAWPVTEAVAEIRRQRGRQFDPDVADALLALVAHPGR